MSQPEEQARSSTASKPMTSEELEELKLMEQRVERYLETYKANLLIIEKEGPPNLKNGGVMKRFIPEMKFETKEWQDWVMEKCIHNSIQFIEIKFFFNFLTFYTFIFQWDNLEIPARPEKSKKN